jgi:hypothetical protein
MSQQLRIILSIGRSSEMVQIVDAVRQRLLLLLLLNG